MDKQPQRRGISFLVPGFFFLAILAAGALCSVMVRATVPTARSTDVLRGVWAAGLRESFEKGLPARETEISLWTSVKYLLFAEGEPGVLVGNDGWLFSTEEFIPMEPTGRQWEEALRYIVSVRDRLASLHIGLVVALVPTKASIYSNRLGRYVLPQSLRERYEAVRRSMISAGITAPDLATPMREAAASHDVFLRTDTHWSAYGASIAAAVLAESAAPALRGSGSLPPASYERRAGITVERWGDLFTFIPLGFLRGALGPAPDRIEEVSTVDVSGAGADLFGGLDIPVALVGTSYSAVGVWDFDGALKAALGADVLKVAAEGMGAFVPMRDYLESPALEDPKPRVVIWEIPERYIAVDVPLGIASLSAAR